LSRLYFPATERNRQVILETLRPRLEQAQQVLEVAAGSGEHMAFFAQQLPQVHWTPSDPVPEHRLSQADWCQDLTNVGPPLELDCLHLPWNCPHPFDAMLAINLLHIAPWSACPGLFQAASDWLKPQGWLYLYGAYLCDDVPTAPSNLAFDESLRWQNPDWGLRRLEEVCEVAEQFGFRLQERHFMPANNLSLFFQR
jgi:cyclopropane fatty-acyl-phospholipid synthase-like methyltransferase